MIVGQIVMQPGEQQPITADFAAELATGETILSATATSKNYATLVDSTATFLTGAVGLSGSKVSILKKENGGAHGETHIVTFKVTTNLTPPGKPEHEVEILVAES